mmetsp:Transcript_21191/g.55102  ORF Transcript_21191/g.55102 Transcript_21191/m.55102 type:complete len:114 (-) Transcript_21191:616-957(-)
MGGLVERLLWCLHHPKKLKRQCATTEKTLATDMLSFFGLLNRKWAKWVEVIAGTAMIHTTRIIMEVIVMTPTLPMITIETIPTLHMILIDKTHTNRTGTDRARVQGGIVAAEG